MSFCIITKVFVIYSSLAESSALLTIGPPTTKTSPMDVMTMLNISRFPTTSETAESDRNNECLMIVLSPLNSFDTDLVGTSLVFRRIDPV